MKTKLPEDLPRRLLAANLALECFAPGTTISHGPRRGFYVHWTRSGQSFSRRWATRGQDFYPVWHRDWAHGGTCCTALANLIRWCQGKSVLPLNRTWAYWISPAVSLARDSGEQLILILRSAGYPEIANCVLCEQPIAGSMDWWSLRGVTGPCCGMRDGCRQKGKVWLETVAKQAALQAAMMEGAA